MSKAGPRQEKDAGGSETSLRARIRGVLVAWWPIPRGDLWTANLEGMRRGRRWLYQMARVFAITLGGLLDPLLGIRAAGLTYFTLLSIVPFLALAFSVLKGLGAYSQLLNTVLWPYLQSNFSSNPAMLQAMQKVLEFVDKTEVGSLGTGGLFFLLYTSGSLLANIETILNQEWGVRQGRPLKRMVTDYLTLIVISPILVVSAGALFTAAQSTKVVGGLQRLLQVTGIWDSALSLLSFATIFVAITALYVIIPHTEVRVRSAAAGGLLASILWQLVLYLQVHLQMGVARYNAIYAGFAAFPIFLFFLWLSWLVVLTGGRLAARHQMQDLRRSRHEAPKMSQRAREQLAVAIVADTVQGVLGGPHPSLQGLANRFEVPVPTVQDIVNELARAGILALVAVPATQQPAESAVVLACDLDAVRLSDLVGALRGDHFGNGEDNRLSSVPPQISELLERMDAQAAHVSREVSLRQLAILVQKGDGAE
jgi:membrane protein